MDDYLKRHYGGGGGGGCGGGGGGGDDDATKKHKHKRKRDKERPHAGGLKVLDVDDRVAVPAGRGDLNRLPSRGVNFEVKRAEDLWCVGRGDGSAKPSAARGRGRPTGTLVSLVGEGAGRADRSPPRRGRHDSPDPSPLRRARHDSPDPSPPRRARNDSPDPSPPRRARHDSPDPSPPRRARNDSPDPSPPRRNDSPDPSPPRRARNDSPDPSPPRRARHERSTSPAGRDASPPRRPPPPPPNSRPPAAPSEREPPGPTPARTFSAPGLHTNVQSEVAAIQAERDAALRATDATTLGAGAETVYRDKHGRKLDYLTEVVKGQDGSAAAAGAGGKGASNAPSWGGGLKQEQEQAQRAAYAQREAAKPFARYADDADLDDRLRHTNRWGDPLAGRLNSDKAKAAAAALRPKYTGPAPPPNRFGQQAGHRWDGVDRSNGFERDFFKMQTNANLRKDEAYKWSTEDM
ncbi:Pre-mRNA-splicing factor of RES complex-domain-containing protein [Pavlovales sp. CCMP2436]|nr:Pre-mRNA-splicing factor of RES complex-domain-containing protein [Pavlovales sp. CCMP2436]